jgi:hypothetical protein
MKTILIAATVATALATATVAHADRLNVTAWITQAKKVITLADKIPLQAERDFTVEDRAIEILRTQMGLVQPRVSEQTSEDQHKLIAFFAQVEQWTAAKEKAVAAEKQAREDVIVPLCDAHITLENLYASMARERANPSGVVNLAELHQIGRMIQETKDEIAAQTPAYVAYRHHGYTKWQDEGACVQAQADRAAADGQ